LNSVLQSLAGLDCLCELLWALVPAGTQGEVVSASADERASLTTQLGVLLARLQLSKERSVSSAADLINAFGWTRAQQREQHDVEELLLLLLDALDREAASRPAANLFKGTAADVLTCACGAERCIPAEFTHLSVTVPSKNEGSVPTLDDLLESSAEAEFLEADCEKCGKRTRTAKKFRVRDWPSVLCVHVLRYVYLPGQGRVKLSTPVTIPETLQSEGAPAYHLVSACIHKGGSSHGGHYCAVARRDGAWYRFNDECVTPIDFGVDFEGETSTTAYLCFYARADVKPAAVPAAVAAVVAAEDRLVAREMEKERAEREKVPAQLR
jgi:ubiquitin C-terminal hydrolase